MIVWLNGTFGCGKTTTAAELCPLIPSSRLFDPENGGIHAAGRFTGQHLITPQTILARAYLEQILAGLRDAGQAVFHVVLDADEDVLRQRIQSSGEPR